MTDTRIVEDQLRNEKRQKREGLKCIPCDVIDTDPLMIKPATAEGAGDPWEVAAINGWSPEVGDRVWALRWDRTALVLGGRATNNPGHPSDLQPHHANLDILSGVGLEAFGVGLLDAADAAEALTLIGAADAAATTAALAGKAATSHTHGQADITGLVAALAALAPAVDIGDIPSLASKRTSGIASVINQLYIVELTNPFTKTTNGIEVYCTANAGSVRAALYNTAGTRLFIRSTNFVTTIGAMQIPWTTTGSLPGGKYFGAVIATATGFTWEGGRHLRKSASIANGAIGPPDPITPPTAPVAADVPDMCLW